MCELCMFLQIWSHILRGLYIIIQLINCRQNPEDYDSKACQLKSQSTIIENGYVHDDNLNTQSNFNKNLEEQNTSDDKSQPSQYTDLQYIIIDMAPVTFIDSCGSKMLEKVSILSIVIVFRICYCYC